MAVALPSDAKLKRAMEKLVLKVDVDSITTKQFIAQLSQRLGGVDLSKKKKFIKMSLGSIIDAVEEKRAAEAAAAKAEQENNSSSSGSGSDGSSTEGEESGEESEEERPPPKKKAKKQVKSTGGGGGLAEVKDISPELAEFLGQGSQMSRTGIVKALWEYIREHDLQNPNDRREIILDEAMQRVFGAERFNMFQMNKYVGAHIHPFKPVDLNSTSESKPKKKQPQKAAAPKKKKGGASQRKPNAAFQAPYRLSADLATVCGTDILPRTQVTKYLWDYIRKNNLQNPSDKRQIICDENFKRVMDGEETVTMFTMNKYVSQHLVEKVDASLYHPPVQEEKKEESSSAASSSGSENESDGNKTSSDTESDNDGSDDDSGSESEGEESS